MKDLIILGAGVHGAEMAEIVERVNRAVPTWNLRCFVAPAKSGERIRQTHNGLPILARDEALRRYPEACLVPDNEYDDPIDVPPERLVSLIDPSSFVSRAARVGRGCVIYPHCFVGLNARLGERVFSLAGSVINHDDVLEDGVVVCSGVTLAGFVHVEAKCYLGQACTVRQFLRIGRGSLIGMGAVVTKDVEPDSVMVGNPAMKLRARKITV